MTLRQLATFLELSRSGSVKAAAERLYVTRPAVSAVVASLQRELGVALVARDGRGLRLTASGVVLAEYARRIQGILDEAAVAAVGAAGAQARVRLGAVTTAAEHILPAAIASFRARHPDAEVSLEVANREHVWERLTRSTSSSPADGRTFAAFRPVRCGRTSW
jgi:LysR family transcriptional regulator, low CO2-responsive transcriptional regulator